MTILLMGVSGCGKSALGCEIARQTGWIFLEGDDFHSARSREKMRQGIPLTDADRRSWLNRIGTSLRRYPDRTVVLGRSLCPGNRDRVPAHAAL